VPYSIPVSNQAITSIPPRRVFLCDQAIDRVVIFL
jgi:hypothetical protein